MKRERERWCWCVKGTDRLSIPPLKVIIISPISCIFTVFLPFSSFFSLVWQIRSKFCYLGGKTRKKACLDMSSVTAFSLFSFKSLITPCALHVTSLKFLSLWQFLSPNWAAEIDLALKLNSHFTILIWSHEPPSNFPTDAFLPHYIFSSCFCAISFCGFPLSSLLWPR